MKLAAIIYAALLAQLATALPEDLEATTLLVPSPAGASTAGVGLGEAATGQAAPLDTTVLYSDASEIPVTERDGIQSEATSTGTEPGTEVRSTDSGAAVASTEVVSSGQEATNTGTEEASSSQEATSNSNEETSSGPQTASSGIEQVVAVTDPTESVESLMFDDETLPLPTPPASAAAKPPAAAEDTETTTNMYPLDNEIRIDSEEIVDVIRNYIAEKDPMLELFLTVCFVHPQCFKFEAPIPGSELGAEAREILQLLQSRRPETARRRLLEKIQAARILIKQKMFQILSEEVGARGVSVAATRNIIDAVKGVWDGVTADLSSVVSSIQEIFSLGIPDSPALQDGMAGVADIIHRIPPHVEQLFRIAAQNGFSRYRKQNSWDSWKL